jgi:hypothetical protein
MRLGIFYFYRKLKKVKIKDLLSEKKQFDNLIFDQDVLPFKIPTSMDEVLDKYNALEKVKTSQLKLTDICYWVIDLDLGEEYIQEEWNKIKKTKGFIRFLTPDDLEMEKNYTEDD